MATLAIKATLAAPHVSAKPLTLSKWSWKVEGERQGEGTSRKISDLAVGFVMGPNHGLLNTTFVNDFLLQIQLKDA